VLELKLSRFGNSFADALPTAEREWFAGAAHRVFTPRGALLAEEGQWLQYLYFPVDALLASWKQYDAGRAACTEIAGRRRAAAYGGVMHWPASDARIEVLCSGEIWRLPFEEFAARATTVNHPLRVALARLTFAASAVNAIRSFCTTEHTVRQRVATLLLYMVAERGSYEIPVTHEQIAALLHVRRPSVSEVLSDLQRIGAVRGTRRQLEVADGSIAENAACACHWAMAKILSSV
jgi:CRP-like cAMP-binding protein